MIKKSGRSVYALQKSNVRFIRKAIMYHYSYNSKVQSLKLMLVKYHNKLFFPPCLSGWSSRLSFSHFWRTSFILGILDTSWNSRISNAFFRVESMTVLKAKILTLSREIVFVVLELISIYHLYRLFITEIITIV